MRCSIFGSSLGWASFAIVATDVQNNRPQTKMKIQPKRRNVRNLWVNLCELSVSLWLILSWQISPQRHREPQSFTEESEFAICTFNFIDSVASPAAESYYSKPRR